MALSTKIPNRADKGLKELLGKILYIKLRIKREKQKDKQISLLFELQDLENQLREIEPVPELGR